MWKLSLRTITVLKQLFRGVLEKKSVLRNSAKFTGKHLCRCLPFIKVAGQHLASLQKRFQLRCFHVNLLKFLRTPILKNCSNGRNWRKTSEATQAYLLSIKVSEVFVKSVFGVTYLNNVKLCHNDKNHQLNQREKLGKERLLIQHK